MSRAKKIFTYTLFFIGIAAYFTYLQSGRVFADPDSFYHAKIGQLMSRGQIVIKDFPWIKFAAFSQNFTDQHFLYHVFLIPFVMIFGALWGAKIASLFLAVAVIGFFYFFLKRWRVRWPLFYTLILLAAPAFIFRINLAKAGPLSLLTLLISLSLLWQKRYRALGFLSFLYVWTYGGWALIIILVCADLIAQVLTKKLSTTQTQNIKYLIFNIQYLKSFLKSIDWKLLKNVLIGIAAGLIINPYFPANLQFYWQQLVQIGAVNYQGVISVGQEWYPYPLWDFIANNAFILILAITALGAFFWKLSKHDVILRPPAEESRTCPERSEGSFGLAQDDKLNFQKILTLIIFAGFLGILTLKSQRFVEYFAPFAVLAGAWLLNFSLPADFSPLKLFSRAHHKRIFNIFVAAYLVLSFVTTMVIKTVELRRLLTSRFNWNYMESAAAWLQTNTPPGSLIYHTNWSDWPMLFYHNARNNYLVGMDPTFFYLYNPTLYRDWARINQGEITEGLAEKIKTDFGARWILTRQGDKKLLDAISKDKNFITQYIDETARIYKIE